MMYLLESPEESERLRAQQEVDDVRERLVTTGLRAGHRVLDAGCGPGLLTRVMAMVVAPNGHVTGVDTSAERIALAQERFKNRHEMTFVRGDVRELPFADGEFDYVFAQFLLQYLPDAERALAELCRVTFRGGRVVVSEIDGAGLHNWPFPAELEDGLRKLLVAAGRSGFDPHIGRKLYSMFSHAGLTDIQVQLHTHYMLAGAADERALNDWRIRFRALTPVAVPEFGSEDAYQRFCDDYLGLLADPHALKYSVLLLTQGVRQ